MLERVKTGLLIVLVAASAYLSLLIWQVLPPPVTAGSSPPVGGTFWGPGIDVVELMKPARIIVHLGPDSHTVLYPGTALFNRAWRPVLDALQQLGGRWSNQPMLLLSDAKNWQAAQQGPGLELVFEFPANLDLWGQVLGYEQVLTTNWPIKRIQLVDQPEPKLIFASPEGDSFASLELPSGDVKLEPFFENALINELPSYEHITDVPTSPFGLFLPKQDLSLPILEISGQRVDPQVVAGSFFADLSLTRRINERDAATIYSDGRRGVRVWPEGRVEYSAPEVLQGVRLPWSQALMRSVRFVTQHGGWFPTMRLAHLQETAVGQGHVFYRLAFRQYEQGLPIVSLPARLELSDRGVASYEREIWALKQTSAKQILTVTAAKEGLAALPSQQEVSDVYPGYVIEPDLKSSSFLQPVWLVEQPDGRLVILDTPDTGGGAK
ncbi:MAG: hypothetical protein ACOYEO_00350 [bacterium]|jgi:hypothetical protein